MTRYALLCWVISTAAFGYALKRDSTGEVVRWPAHAAFVVDAHAADIVGDPNVFSAVTGAVQTVDAGADGLTLSVSAGETHGIGYDFGPGAVNQSEISFPDEWDYDPNAIAITIVTVNTASHTILDADIAFNPHHHFKVL